MLCILAGMRAVDYAMVAFRIGAWYRRDTEMVNDVLLPVVAPRLREESWREAAVRIGPMSISYGICAADLINFLILAIVIFLVARKVLAMEKGGNKK